MLSVQGLLAKDLKAKGALPEKFNDLALEETVPRDPIIDSCFLYLDAINNTGSGHNANYKSGSRVAWKNLCGSQQVFTSNDPDGDNLPIIYDDSIFLGYTGNWNRFFRCFTNGNIPSLWGIYRHTIETVLTVPANNGGFFIYGTSTSQSLFFASNRRLCFSVYNSNANTADVYYFSLDSIPVGTRIYIISRFDNGNLTIDIPQYKLHFEQNSIACRSYKTNYESAWIALRSVQGWNFESFFTTSYMSSLRVHNRVLSDSELYMNYKYESSRYNIPEIK